MNFYWIAIEYTNKVVIRIFHTIIVRYISYDRHYFNIYVKSIISKLIKCSVFIAMFYIIYYEKFTVQAHKESIYFKIYWPDVLNNANNVFVIFSFCYEYAKFYNNFASRLVSPRDYFNVILLLCLVVFWENKKYRMVKKLSQKILKIPYIVFRVFGWYCVHRLFLNKKKNL